MALREETAQPIIPAQISCVLQPWVQTRLCSHVTRDVMTPPEPGSPHHGLPPHLVVLVPSLPPHRGWCSGGLTVCHAARQLPMFNHHQEVMTVIM